MHHADNRIHSAAFTADRCEQPDNPAVQTKGAAARYSDRSGVCAGLAGMHVQLHPELFMFVFLPPLLFADAFRMPLREFGELRGPILFLAFGLVVLSTLLCGYAIHWILPVMSLPVCFTLSAALSPTDTVAVSSLIKAGGCRPGCCSFCRARRCLTMPRALSASVLPWPMRLRVSSPTSRRLARFCWWRSGGWPLGGLSPGLPPA